MTTTDFFSRPAPKTTTSHARRDGLRLAVLLGVFALSALVLPIVLDAPATISAEQWNGNSVGHAMK